MRLTDTKKDLTGGGAGSFFKIPEGQSAVIRFLYNTIDDIKADGLVAHAIPPQESGQQYTVNVLCGLTSDDDPITNCKWCATNHKQVGRYPLALFNVDDNSVQYWLKSAQYVEGLIDTLKEIVPQGQPISGQIFKMIRSGKGTNTQYNLIPQGVNDGKTADQFGEVKAPEERNLLRPADYDFPVITNGGVNFQNNGGFNQQNFNGGYNQQGFNQGGQNFQSTRRTTDVF